VIPKNVNILVLPTYSPELNPVEVLWNVGKKIALQIYIIKL
jgi:transposase